MKTATRSHLRLMKVTVICLTNAYSRWNHKKLLMATEPTTKIVFRAFGDLSEVAGFLHMRTMMCYHIFKYIFIYNAFDEYMSLKTITQLIVQRINRFVN